MKLNRVIYLIAAVVIVACGGDDNSHVNPPIQIDPDCVAEQLSRKPFFEYNPESGVPSVVVSDTEHRLEFAGWGAEDKGFTLTFPEEAAFRRVIMKYTMSSEGSGPAIFDNTVLLYVRDKSDGEWYEIARVFTPFGGEFDALWEKSFFLDVTEYQSMLYGATEFKYYYAGFDATAERAHTFAVSFYGYDGESEEVVGVERIYDSSLNPNTGYRSWAYGVEEYDIEDAERLGERTLNIPAGTSEVLLRVVITGHGHDIGIFPNREGYNVINAAEFDDNYYYLTVDGTRQRAIGHIFYSNAENYYQAGTYYYDRANWAPGNPANTHYWRLQRASASSESCQFNIDLEPFISSFDLPNAEGVANYIVSVYAFYIR